MERLYKGIHRFQQTLYKQEEEFFRLISKGQSPDVLFFACSDSRVDPNLITQSKPGELFIVKNVGNIVPPNTQSTKKTCTAAAIEFALKRLNVTDIVVCGHSDCGAINALWSEEADLEGMPNLGEWLDTVSDVKKAVSNRRRSPSCKSKMDLTERVHIIQQLENLKTYPLVMEALAARRLKLHGWYYDIVSGTVYVYNPRNSFFEKIHYSESTAPPCADKGCGGPH